MSFSYLDDVIKSAGVTPLNNGVSQAVGDIAGNAARFATAQITSVTKGAAADDIIREAMQTTAAAAKAVASVTR